MTYGTIKVDTVTFTDAGVDKSVTLSGLVQNPTFSGNVTVTGTLSGVTVTGTTANFASGNFTNISGGTHTIASGVFAAGSAASPSITFTGDLNTGIYSPGADQVAISTNGTKRIEIQADGDIDIDNGGVFYDATNNRLAIGTTSPGAIFHVKPATDENIRFSGGSGDTRIACFNDAASSTVQLSIQASPFLFRGAGGAEVGRWDTSGRLLVGTSTTFDQSAPLQVNSSTGYSANLYVFGADNSQVNIGSARGSVGSPSTLNSNDTIGGIYFRGHDGTSFKTGAQIQAQIDGITPSSDLPSRLVFSTTADGASSPTERMRITNAGDIYIGQTLGTQGVAGIIFQQNGYGNFIRNDGSCIYANRRSNDGTLVEFAQADVTEGTISVSGTTVSYNGAHLSRWSQLPSGAERTEILRGTVLSNIDEMCEWGDEENEQLNRMKVSDVEGDKNVSGVFQAWDDDDDTYTNDFYCAMTGDFIIRIGAGITVQRGDLLMSAGDGTAKPQEDDIIRSKTIAKVTSTNVTCTYEDGSYCVPCVLMAC